jgi:hypothetical protein
MDSYKIKLHSHNPDVAEKIMGKIGAEGLIKLLQDEVASLQEHISKRSFIPSESIFGKLMEKDFDIDDALVKAFFEMDGPGKINKMRKLRPNEAIIKVSSDLNKLMNIRNSQVCALLRHAYNSLQNAAGHDSEAIKFEKVAYKLEDKSRGSWQLDALETLDELLKVVESNNSSMIKTARNHVLKGDSFNYSKAIAIIRNQFESITPSSNVRVAYTTLQTQFNEPYLLCPKGIFQGYKSAVPMEVSKCRDHCIDSRLAKDGTVSCAYEAWLKVSFKPQEQVMARLNVHKHPDNDANALELNEGERSKKLTEGEIPFETRFEKNQKGYKRDSLPEESIEKRLESSGHRNVEKTVKKAQSITDKTIENQLPRTNESKKDFLNELIEKLHTSGDELLKTRQEQLGKDSLYSHKDEMDESFAKQLNDFSSNAIDIKKEINDEAGDGSEDSISHLLNKTAKKDVKLDEKLEESRNNPKDIKPKNEQLEDRRTIKNDKDIDASIEALLEEEDYYDHYSEEELEDFVNKLKDAGIDTLLEDKRKSNLEY